MRLLTVFKKTMIENFRDWKIIVLTVTFAPFFVLLMHFYMGAAAKTFKVALVNEDRGAATASGETVQVARDLLAGMANQKHPDGTAVVEIVPAASIAKAKEMVREKVVDLAVAIPEGFSRVLLDFREGRRPPAAEVRSWGDPANARYIMAAAYCDYLVFQAASLFTGQEGPVELNPVTIGKPRSPSDFDLYVPALLGLSMMMLMFTAAASLIKEMDKGTIVRLQISNLRVSEYVAAISLSQIVIGILSLALTYACAVALGYRSSGSPGALMVVGLLSCLSIIAISILVAAFLRTIFDLLTIGCFPFFILMFFSGGMFPLPALPLLRLAGRPFNLADILPTSHSITAMNKILNFGAGLGDVAYELAAIAVLTLLYFWVGMVLFRRRHLRAT